MSEYRKPEQLALDLDGRGRGSSHSDNLYFAVLPDEEILPRIVGAASDLRRQHGLSSRIRPARLLHITLAGVGEFDRAPDAAVAAAKRMGDGVRVAPFIVTFDRASSFITRDSHPLVLRCDQGTAELTRLRNALGRSGARSAFAPHVTLMYDRQTIPDTNLEPITWTVREFVLVHSLVGKSRHNHLARWRLDG